MADGSLPAALWQTFLTMRKDWQTRFCQRCLSMGLRSRLRHVVTERGYVRRCWQCGGEFVHSVTGTRMVWPQ